MILSVEAEFEFKFKYHVFFGLTISSTMDFFWDENDSNEINLHSQEIFSYCLTLFKSYESLLSEFSNINGLIDHDVVLRKIEECGLAVRNILEFADGPFTVTLFGLLNRLQEFSDAIEKRKTHEKSSNEMNMLATGKNKVEKPWESKSTPTKLIDAVRNTIEIPRVNGLHNLAGLEEIKKVLKTMFLLPIKHPQLFVNRKTSNKLLLFGPPGTGKTLLAHAIAAEIKAVFHNISSSDIFSPLVGESEKMMKCLFQSAKESNEYTILFIDEIDAFCRTRSSSEQAHSRRLITEMMCQMNSIEDCPNIFVIGATNCPWDLDSAILRRFHKRIFVPLPDKNEREELLKFYTDETQLSTYEASQWNQLLDITEGLSSSDLASLVQNAMDIPLMELQETRVWKKTIDDFYEPADREDNYCKIIWKRLEDLPENSVRSRPLKLLDLISAAQSFKPTVSQEWILKYDAFIKK
ncbi:vacuolar protein sorting-associated protein 4-like [Coccinella septempunctata]|uniref:vacuolar protein sorting-associated protein 4-like n=1 Tax=Coccinella septempunctata TaxID=41139 RepID=UPI001D07D2D5|nr:vacuolar protein sorting-associated protein 4-like [Coccinella septempunctata]